MRPLEGGCWYASTGWSKACRAEKTIDRFAFIGVRIFIIFASEFFEVRRVSVGLLVIEEFALSDGESE